MPASCARRKFWARFLSQSSTLSHSPGAPGWLGASARGLGAGSYLVGKRGSVVMGELFKVPGFAAGDLLYGLRDFGGLAGAVERLHLEDAVGQPLLHAHLPEKALQLSRLEVRILDLFADQ